VEFSQRANGPIARRPEHASGHVSGAAMAFRFSAQTRSFSPRRRRAADSNYQDTWEWDSDSGTWNGLGLTSGSRPSGRSQHAMVL